MKKTIVTILLVTSMFYLLGVSSCERNSWAGATSLALSSWDLYLTEQHITWQGQGKYDEDSKSLVSAIQAGSVSEISAAAGKVALDLAGYKGNQTETQLISAIIVAVNDALTVFGVEPVTVASTGQTSAMAATTRSAVHPAAGTKLDAKQSHQNFVAQWNALNVKPAVK